MMTLFPEALLLIISFIIYILNAGGEGGSRCSDVCNIYDGGGIVDCQGRSLSHIPEECRRAKQLNIQDNSVHSLPRDSFRNFTSLFFLNLTNNNMTVDRGAFHGCEKLTIIHLSHNHLPTLNQGLMKGLSGVAHMHIDNANVRDIEPETYADLGHLEILSLKKNRLSTPPCTAFRQDVVLEKLDLSDNSISNLPDGCFERLSFLTTLLMQNNPLTYPNRKAFRGLKCLAVLNLQNTNLVEVPTGIFAYTNMIHYLNLAFNSIRHLSSRAFASLPELREVSLQYNRIVTIHAQSFEFLSSIQYLDLHHNLINSICDGAFQQFQELRELKLQNNLLRSIENITLEVLTEDASINLANNPLHCDCSISPLWRRVKNSTETDREHDATCSSPEKLRNRFIIHLSESDICPEARPTEIQQRVLQIPPTESKAYTSHPTTELFYILLLTIILAILGND